MEEHMEKYFPIHNIAPHQESLVELPEIAMQKKMREGYEYKPSAGNWYWPAICGEPFSDDDAAKLLLAEKSELPALMSAVLERTCNLRCDHCLYQDEKSSASLSRSAHLEETIMSMVSQMPQASGEYQPSFMSAGRILRPAHLELFQRLRESRPEVKLGVIDNGTYTKLFSRWPEGFKFDWMDISVDGVESTHNKQRQSPEAFRIAMEGLRMARDVVRPPNEGGRVTSLFTLTKLNAQDISAVAEMLLEKNEKYPLADWMCVTTMSPTNEINTDLEITVDDFTLAWKGMCEVSRKYNPQSTWNDQEGRRFEFGIYRTEDMEKLAAVIGEKRLLEAFSSKGGSPLRVDGNFLKTKIDGVPIKYLPLSIWTPEEFLIEADGAYRTAYEGMFTLEELRSGRANDGRDTKPYTIEQLRAGSNFRSAYEHGVDHFWTHFGKKKFAEECEIWRRIREKAVM